ncbi:MAG: hypothetical protein KC912_14130 [Proteobacteria bacterium]|nr:hypothetical protein [Pseudomonadota bacterium]
MKLRIFAVVVALGVLWAFSVAWLTGAATTEPTAAPTVADLESSAPSAHSRSVDAGEGTRVVRSATAPVEQADVEDGDLWEEADAVPEDLHHVDALHAGPLMDLVSDRINECTSEWPEADARVFHIAAIEIEIQVPAASAEGVTQFDDVRAEAILTDGSRLHNVFFDNCVALGLEGQQVRMDPDEGERTFTTRTDIERGDLEAEFERLLADEQALASRGMTREDVERLRDAARAADPLAE